MFIYGLVGKSLKHSFSKNYFEQKFLNENIANHYYHLFEIESIEQIESVFLITDLKGINVTIPYKEQIIPYLDFLDNSALITNAVNVVKIENGIKTGYNTDYYGFLNSLVPFYKGTHKKALILGDGGAAKAVRAVLKHLGIDFIIVSRAKKNETITYSDVDKELIDSVDLIINTTPLGMFPQVNSFSEIPYQFINSSHFVYDLVYNPNETLFLKYAKERGANIKNGLQMLELQADKAWEIWKS